jgi:hypothetical protein
MWRHVYNVQDGLGTLETCRHISANDWEKKRMRYAKCFSWPALLVGALTAALGCGGGGPKPVKVEGVVTLDGKPLPAATVTFVPAGDGRAASGRTEQDGTFRLTTYRTDDGALPGEYKVTVVVEKPTDERFVGKDPHTFTDKEKAEARMTHTPAGKAKALAAKKKQVSPVPVVYSDPKTTTLKETVPPAGKVELNLRSGAR